MSELKQCQGSPERSVTYVSVRSSPQPIGVIVIAHPPIENLSLVSRRSRPSLAQAAGGGTRGSEVPHLEEAFCYVGLHIDYLHMDLLQGALDMLVLRTLVLAPLHG
jgi:hypothetical protein